MPRDLEDERAQLTQSPDKFTDTASNEGAFSAFPGEFAIMPQDHTPNLHPYTRPLTISDTESSVVMDAVAFTNPEERASREKVGVLLFFSGHGALGRAHVVIHMAYLLRFADSV